MFRKAILKPFSLGMESRLVITSLLTLFEKLLLSNVSMFGSHIPCDEVPDVATFLRCHITSNVLLAKTVVLSSAAIKTLEKLHEGDDAT